MRSGRPPIYDWDALLDGKAHIVEQGVDFSCKLVSFRQLAHRTADARGLRARVKIGDGKNGLRVGQVRLVARERA